jgi:cellulose 1,4-beta-cellobiosidase
VYSLASNPAALTAQDVSTGATRWNFSGDGQLITAPIVLSTPSGEFVVEGSSSGMLYALDATTGTVVWSTNMGAAIPGADEQNEVQLNGLSAGQGLLVVPAGNAITAFGAAPPPPPSVPGGLKATAGNGQVSLSWSASSGTAPITYSVYRGTASGAEGSTPIASGLTSASYVDTGVANGTTYYYEVRASNAGGSSGVSAEASATPVAPPTLPGAPTNVTAAPGNGQVSLSWSASSGTAPITYSVYRGTASGNESATPIVSGLTATSYTDTGLANGTTYYYEVRATNAAGSSGFSAEASAKPVAPPTVPGAPSLSAASARGKGVALSWNAPANGGSAITSYTVYRGTSPGSELAYGSVICSSSTCSYTDVNTKHGTVYVYQVAAVNAVGTGPRSNEASATG